jgi:hypothetical protein
MGSYPDSWCFAAASSLALLLLGRLQYGRGEVSRNEWAGGDGGGACGSCRRRSHKGARRGWRRGLGSSQNMAACLVKRTNGDGVVGLDTKARYRRLVEPRRPPIAVRSEQRWLLGRGWDGRESSIQAPLDGPEFGRPGGNTQEDVPIRRVTYTRFSCLSVPGPEVSGPFRVRLGQRPLLNISTRVRDAWLSRKRGRGVSHPVAPWQLPSHFVLEGEEGSVPFPTRRFRGG